LLAGGLPATSLADNNGLSVEGSVTAPGEPGRKAAQAAHHHTASSGRELVFQTRRRPLQQYHGHG
jgi:hypothetical protein